MRVYSIGKPGYVKSFKQDLAQNFHNHFLSEGRQIYLRDVIKECEVYAMDICLHFKQESGGVLPEDWKKHLIAETYDTILQLFPAAEEDYSLETCMFNVTCELNNGTARRTVDNYYDKFH